MKTIKEKAEEYSFIRQGIGPSGIQYRDFSINKKDGFEAGAYYVLNLLCETIHVSKDAYLKNNLFEMIKQLKK